MIYLVGLGAGGAREISADALGALRRARRVILRTANHPAANTLRLAGIAFESLDALVPDADAETRARALAEFVINAAREADPVAYAVPGHPLIAEDSVRLVMERAQQAGISTRLVPSRSFLEPVLEAVGYGMSHGLQVLDAGTLPRVQPNPNLAQIYYQLETPELASRVKTHLLRHYPPDFPVTLVHAAGVEGATEVKTIPLAQLAGRRSAPGACCIACSLASAAAFDIEQVIQRLNGKLVQRHPHVFGDISLENADEVLRNWDRLKREQKAHASILEGIPRSMPALMRALEVSKRAARAGFEWENIQGVLDKLHEEESELRRAIERGELASVESEIGDLLFTAVNVARHAGVDPEESLRRMVDRFIQRFRWMEATAAQQGRSLEALSPDEWESLWQAAKRANDG